VSVLDTREEYRGRDTPTGSSDRNPEGPDEPPGSGHGKPRRLRRGGCHRYDAYVRGTSIRAVRTAVSLYQSGTLGLEEAARTAGVSPGRFRVSLRMQGIENPEPVLAD